MGRDGQVKRRKVGPRQAGLSLWDGNLSFALGECWALEPPPVPQTVTKHVQDVQQSLDTQVPGKVIKLWEEQWRGWPGSYLGRSCYIRDSCAPRPSILSALGLGSYVPCSLPRTPPSRGRPGMRPEASGTACPAFARSPDQSSQGSGAWRSSPAPHLAQEWP